MYAEQDTSGVILPIKFQFIKIFEKDDNLQECLKFMDEFSQNHDTISHFIQGELWKTKCALYPNDICIPYFFTSMTFK